MKKRKIIILLLILAAAGGVLWWSFVPKGKFTSYNDFWREVESGEVLRVVIDGDELLYYKKTGGEAFCTPNPASPTLIERLLEKDVKVEKAKDWGEVLSIAFDIFTLLLIVFVVGGAVKKIFDPTAFKVVKSKTRFSDVVGLDDAKSAVMQIIDVLRNPSSYKKLGVRLPKGVLLVGEPGNGKTLFARAIAGEAKVPFIATKATDFESMFMSIGPAKVKSLFSKARRREPCVVFIDEFDGIGTKRNYSGSAIETENTRIVTALLNELDGFQKNTGILVLAATNSLNALDAALIRPGRFDVKINIPYPKFDTRVALIKLYTKEKSCAVDAEALAKLFDGFSCAKIESTLNRAALLAQQKGKKAFSEAEVKEAIRQV